MGGRYFCVIGIPISKGTGLLQHQSLKMHWNTGSRESKDIYIYIQLFRTLAIHRKDWKNEETSDKGNLRNSAQEVFGHSRSRP